MALRQYISTTRSQGRASRQAHCDLPDGTFERELGKEGFFGPATMMYHEHPPTGWLSWEGPLRPRAFDLNEAGELGPSPWDALVVLHNANCKMRYWRTDSAMDHLARNADGDELLFLHRGGCEFYCDYGHLTLARGDYVVIPRSTMWRIEPSEPVELLLIENTGGTYMLPDKGIVGRHAIFDPGMLDAPAIDAAFEAQKGDDQTVVKIKQRDMISTVTYPFNPLDAVGWHGDLSPTRLNIKDIRPLMSHRLHLPPSAHTTWVGNGFVVCTFVPRPFETDPGAMKIPFFHNNDDYDEVIFYHDGDFFSRDNIGPGMVTFHPCGFTHGPHPKALQRMFDQPKAMTEEYAVMIDTRRPLEPGPRVEPTEQKEYARSWLASAGAKAPKIPTAAE
ncbi:MAG: homogentisate 1,2-dioxygenase [Alphaproteobacteria bacterium]